MRLDRVKNTLQIHDTSQRTVEVPSHQTVDGAGLDIGEQLLEAWPAFSGTCRDVVVRIDPRFRPPECPGPLPACGDLSLDAEPLACAIE